MKRRTSLLERGKAQLDAFARNRSGATAVEYALIAGILTIAIAAIVFSIGNELSGGMQDIADDFPNK